MSSTVSLFILVFWSLFSCNPGEPEEDFVRFQLNEKEYHFQGKSDIHSEFYSYNYPDYHTPEKIRKGREENPHIFSGRMMDESKKRMVELFVEFPEGKSPSLADLNALEGDTVWTPNIAKGNVEEGSFMSLGPSARFYFLDTRAEYLPNLDLGYIFIRKLTPTEESRVRIEGSFSFSVNGYGQEGSFTPVGEFKLEFYRGL